MTRRALGGMAAPADLRGRARWVLHLYGSRLAGAALLVYAAYAASTLGFTPHRFWAGLGHGRMFLARLFPPDFLARWSDIQHDMLESLEIAVLASVIGILASLPLGLLAARNLTVGRWSAIGAGGVVIGDIPDSATAVGVPAKVIDTASAKK